MVVEVMGVLSSVDRTSKYYFILFYFLFYFIYFFIILVPASRKARHLLFGTDNEKDEERRVQ